MQPIERRERYRQRVDAGLCGDCGEPSLAGFTRCARCLERQRAAGKRHAGKMKEKRAQRRESGLCTSCGVVSDAGNECSRCRERKAREYRVRYDAARAAGLCVHCRKAPSAGGRVDCDACNARHRPDPDVSRARQAAAREELRRAVFAHYGEACSCCGEGEPKFLTIDHINGDGADHRRLIGSSGLYRWLRRNGFPEGFQTLCFNCNSGRHLNGGVCPHVA